MCCMNVKYLSIVLRKNVKNYNQMFYGIAGQLGPLKKRNFCKLAHTILSFSVLIPWHTTSELNIHLPFQLAACFTMDHTKR